MSTRRREAKRISQQAAADLIDENRPAAELDRTFVISFLEMDPDVMAALNGQPYEPEPITMSPQAQAAFEAQFDVVEPEPVLAAVEEAPDQPAQAADPVIIDVSATVIPLNVERVQATKRSRQVRKPARKTARPKTKTSPAPEAADQLASIHELHHDSPAAEQVVAQAAVAEEVVRQVASVDLTVTQAPAGQQIASMEDLNMHPTMAAAMARAQERNLPFVVPDFTKVMAQIKQAGWSLPAVRRAEWDYMNFQMPPVSNVILSPRQKKRQEWKTMMMYFRINPYKSHYRQDQKSARRLLTNAKRAGLDLA